jgi:hypothetical protein
LPAASRGEPLSSNGRGGPVISSPSVPDNGGRGRGIVRRDSRRPGHAAGATRHEQEMMQAKSSNQGLMRKQMNALRAQIKKNSQELDRMKARDAERESVLLVRF